MHPTCKKCPAGERPCSFQGFRVKDAINCCQLIPIFSAFEYVGGLTDKEKNSIVGHRPLEGVAEEYTRSLQSAPSMFPKGRKSKALTVERIALIAVNGKDGERLNLN